MFSNRELLHNVFFMLLLKEKKRKKHLRFQALYRVKWPFSWRKCDSNRASFHDYNRANFTLLLSELFILSKLLESHAIPVGQEEKGQLHCS